MGIQHMGCCTLHPYAGTGILGALVPVAGPEREWKATWMAKHAKKAKMMAGGCGMQIHTL